ncbi:Hypothetical_protein [Hexamita inflata]|uniref:Hypothetical_protein n=1 Tax=Hexamita inflata TaxID=28002 RepID=A0ABP1HNT2_9EUKA
MEVEDHKQNNCCFRVASIYYLMLARLTHLIPFFKKQKCIHYLNIENESDCNYLNYNSNQASTNFILSSRLRLKKKSSIVFRDQEIPKIVQIDPVKMNTEVLCRSSACATSYKLHIASQPIIGSSYSFLQSAQHHIFSRQNLSQISLLTKTQKLHRTSQTSDITSSDCTIFYEFIRWTQK